MAHPINLLAKLTTQSKQIDGMGFGGITSDKLEVAGAMGFPHPTTKKRLIRNAELLARYAYCFDDSCKKELCRALFDAFRHKSGKIADDTLNSLCNVAAINYKHELIRFNKDNRSQERFDLTDSQLAALIGIHRKNITARHRDIYDEMYKLLCCWESDATNHIKAAIAE